MLAFGYVILFFVAVICGFIFGAYWRERNPLKLVIIFLSFSVTVHAQDFSYTPPAGASIDVGVTFTESMPYWFGDGSMSWWGQMSGWDPSKYWHSSLRYFASMDEDIYKNAFWAQNTNELLYGVFGPEGSGTEFFSDFKEYARDFKISYVETAEGVTKVSVEMLGFKDKFSEMLGKTSTIAENTVTIAGHLDSIETSFIATNERLDTLRVTVNSVDGKMSETNNLLGEIKNNGINANMQGVEGRLDGIGGQLGVINSTLNQILNNGINADMSGLEQKLDTTNQTLGTVGQNTAGMAMDLVEIKNAVWALGNQGGTSMMGVENRLDGIRQRMDSPFDMLGTLNVDTSQIEQKMDIANGHLYNILAGMNNGIRPQVVEIKQATNSIDLKLTEVNGKLGEIGQSMGDLVYVGDGIWARIGDQIEEQEETNRLLGGELNISGSVAVDTSRIEQKLDTANERLYNILAGMNNGIRPQIVEMKQLMQGFNSNQQETNDLLNQILNQDSSVDLSETNGLLGDILDVLTDFYGKFSSLFEDTGDSLGNGDDIVGKATELKKSIDDLQDFTDGVDSSPLESLKNQIPDSVGVTPHSWTFSCMVYQQRIEIQMPDIPHAAVFRGFLSGLFIAMTAVYAVMIIIKNVREFA